MNTKEITQIFSVSEKDANLVDVLINNPRESLEDLAKILKVTKQALSKRKRKLEKYEIIKTYLFWNILPKFEATKYFEIVLKGDPIDNEKKVLEELNKNWTIIVIWKNIEKPKATIAGLVLTERSQDFVKWFKNLNFIAEVKIIPILIRQFLGDKVRFDDSLVEYYLRFLEDEIKKLSRENDVLAVLYGIYPEEENVDICIIRSRVSGKGFYSYEKVITGIYFDYHIMTYKMFEEVAIKETDWVATLKIGFVKDKNIERKINGLLKFSKRKSTCKKYASKNQISAPFEK